MSNEIAALLLIPFALALVVGLLALLAPPLLAPVVGVIERARFQHALARAARADSYLAARHLDGALRELRAAFCLQVVRGDRRLVDQIVRHHDGLLSRFLTLADDVPHQRVRLFALKKVDRLLDRRRDMQRQYLQLQRQWWRDANRLRLERELHRNAIEVRLALQELIADLQVLTQRTAAVH